MADQDLKIRITVQGEKELNALIKKYNEQNITIEEGIRLRKLFNEQAKKYVNLMGEQTSAGQKFIDGQRRINASFSEHNIKIGAAHEKYFALGQQIREHIVANGMLGSSLGGVVNNFMNITTQVHQMKEASAAGMSQMEKSVQSIGIAGMAAGGVIAAIAATVGGVFALKEFAHAGARIEMLRNQLSLFTKKEGKSAEELILQLKKATGGTVSEIDLLQQAVQFKIVGIRDNNLVQILSFADERAKLLGKDFNEVAQIMLKADLGATKRAARSLNLQIDTEHGEKVMANLLGVQVKYLTEKEKRQAFFNELLAAAGTQQDELNGASIEAINSSERLNAAWTNLKNTFSESATAGKPLFDMMTGVLNKVSEVAGGADTKEFSSAMLGVMMPWTIPGAIEDRIAAAKKAQAEMKARKEAPLEIELPASEKKREKTEEELKDEEEAEKKSADKKLKIEQDAYKEREKSFEAFMKNRKSRIEYYANDRDSIRAMTGLLGKTTPGMFQESYKEVVSDAVMNRANMNIALQGRALGERVRPGTAQLVRGIGTKSTAEIVSKEAKLSFGEWINEGEQFTNSLKSGLENSVGGFSDALTRSFKLGDSLIGKFAANLLAATSNALATRAGSGIFDLIFGAAKMGAGVLTGGMSTMLSTGLSIAGVGMPFANGGWINERVTGIGHSSGKTYSIGEEGPERISNMSQVNQEARFANRRSANSAPIVKLIPIIDNVGISMRAEVGNVNLAGRRI